MFSLGSIFPIGTIRLTLVNTRFIITTLLFPGNNVSWQLKALTAGASILFRLTDYAAPPGPDTNNRRANER